jgi:multiple sugar transport system permease protein
MKDVSLTQKIMRWTFKLIGVFAVFIIFFPVFWMARSSLIASVRMFEKPPPLFFIPTLGAYRRAFINQRLLGRMINSIIISVFATGISVFLGSMAAYGINRFKMPFSKHIPFVFLFLRMLPTIVMLLPLYLMLSRANMIDTYSGIIIVYVSVVIPTVVWLMWSFFKTMPKEIEESAYIDGSGYLMTFMKIVVPITSPALASVSILAFTASWNEFIMATILTRTRTTTLPPAVVSLMTQPELNWAQISAGSVILSIPVILLCIFAQKYFVKGLTVGAVKG